MGQQDGAVTGVEKLVDHGPDSRRFVIAIMGDGFKSSSVQQRRYRRAADRFVATLQTSKPFDELWPRINIHRVDVASLDEGADMPGACSGSGRIARTYLDATYCGDGRIERLLTVNQAFTLLTANRHVPNHDIIVVIVNHTLYGGSGAQRIAVYSLADSAYEVALHELGHSAFNLADEYEYYRGCSVVEPDRSRFTGAEPNRPNVTTKTNLADVKWRSFIAAGTSLPTTTNNNCDHCRNGGVAKPAGGVGLFIGANTYHCGIFRPTADCLMRTVGNKVPFCVVCQDAIKKVVLGDTAGP